VASSASVTRRSLRRAQAVTRGVGEQVALVVVAPAVGAMGREIRTIFAGEPPIDGWLGFEEVKRDALRT